jgi:hypothetical protein
MANHLHLDRNDPFVHLLTDSIGSASKGSIVISLGGQPAAVIEINRRVIDVDMLQAALFKVPQDRTSLRDKLKTAKEFGERLSANDLTISFRRDGKKAVTLGRNAKPTLSWLITRSKGLQLNSVRQFFNLKLDLKTG